MHRYEFDMSIVDLITLEERATVLNMKSCLKMLGNFISGFNHSCILLVFKSEDIGAEMLPWNGQSCCQFSWGLVRDGMPPAPLARPPMDRGILF